MGVVDMLVVLVLVTPLIVGLVFYAINSQRCRQGKRPIGFGSRATCDDMRTHDDLFTRYPIKRRH